jgi:hypothetical protein
MKCKVCGKGSNHVVYGECYVCRVKAAKRYVSDEEARKSQPDYPAWACGATQEKGVPAGRVLGGL